MKVSCWERKSPDLKRLASRYILQKYLYSIKNKGDHLLSRYKIGELTVRFITD